MFVGSWAIQASTVQCANGVKANITNTVHLSYEVGGEIFCRQQHGDDGWWWIK